MQMAQMASRTDPVSHSMGSGGSLYEGKPSRSMKQTRQSSAEVKMHRTIPPQFAFMTCTGTPWPLPSPLWGFEGKIGTVMGDGVLVLRFRVCMFYFSKDESWQTIDRGEVSSAVMFLTLDVPYLYSVFFQHLSASVNNSQKAAWIFYTDETHQQISFVSKVSPWKPRLRK